MQEFLSDLAAALKGLDSNSAAEASVQQLGNQLVFALQLCC